MTPKQLAHLLTAAHVVDAIDDRELQARRAWNLTGWHYDLVHWGVRFRCLYRKPSEEAEILAVLGQHGRDGAIRHPDRGGVDPPESFVVRL